MRCTVRVGLVVSLALVAACPGAPFAGTEAPTTTPIGAQEAESEAPPVARLNELEDQCRSQIPALTFQEAARTLSRVRASIGRLCSVELVGDMPLEWRVSCGSDDFFGSGEHGFASPTACEGGANAFECLGHGLRSMLPHAQSIDIAVVGHVDLELPSNRRLNCTDLVEQAGGQAWADSPWGARFRRDREPANQRLAWCRAARAAAAVRTGLDEARGVRLTAIGATSSWLEARMDPSAEGATCPAPTTEADVAESGRCQTARRVDVLVRLDATAAPTGTSCRRERDSPEGALFCLEECLARPERSAVGLDQSTSFFGAGAGQRERAGFHVTSTEGAGPVDLASVLQRLGLL